MSSARSSAEQRPSAEQPLLGKDKSKESVVPSLSAFISRAKAAVSTPPTPSEARSEPSPRPSAKAGAGTGAGSSKAQAGDVEADTRNAQAAQTQAPAGAPPAPLWTSWCGPSTSRIGLGLLLVLLAAAIGAIGGALFDHSRAAGTQRPRQPMMPPHGPKRPGVPASPSRPGGSAVAPAEPHVPAKAGHGSPPPPIYVGPAGGEPPKPARCHFTQPSNAKDPTALDPGEDTDPMRAIEFVNQCDGDLMVNIQGFTFWDTGRWRMQGLPQDGGFPLRAGESRTEYVSERMYSGRIWARPNCKRPCNIVSCGNPHNVPVHCTFKNGSKTPDCLRDGLWCDTGNCPGGNETTCRGQVGEFIGGLPPGPLMELTLCGGRGARIACYKDGPAYNQQECDSLPTSDYYDISNVDGTSLIWAGMEVSRGRRLTGPYAPQGRFNCGSPMMPSQFDMRTCPQPLRVARNDSNPHGYSPNASVAAAIGCLSACNFMSQVAWSAPGQPPSVWTADRTLSQAKMERPTQEDVSAVTTEDVSRTCCECGHLGDRGVCPAPKVDPDGTVTWPGENSACFAGCSPYANYPESYSSSMCKLEYMPSIKESKHGASIPLGEVQAIFKKWSPEAYSWQFDDMSSTYMCEAADFKLIFCPRKGAPPRTASAI